MDTTQANIKIDTFYTGRELSKNGLFMFNNVDDYRHNAIFVRHLAYDSDWNLLMGVVDKIEEMGHTVDIDGIVCEIVVCGSDQTFIMDHNTKIAATFAAVSQFVDWFEKKGKE